jgi:hypothetical protein
MSGTVRIQDATAFGALVITIHHVPAPGYRTRKRDGMTDGNPTNSDMAKRLATSTSVRDSVEDVSGELGG